MEFHEFLGKIARSENLSEKEAEEAMNVIMRGEATNAQIGAFLMGLEVKGASVEEITAFAKTMRANAQKIAPKVSLLADTCGTGGDRSGTFNVSTAAAFVVAGAGVAVAKHGNRSVSSKCGSADVLEALGVNVSLTPEEVEKKIEKLGIGFMFAPTFHPAMKYVAQARKEMKVKTVFNVLGPLSNPANASVQLVGVFKPELTETLAYVLKNLGVKSALVVHGSGLDEISICGSTRVSELRSGKVKNYEITPDEFGIKRAKLEEILGSDAKGNAEILKAVLSGKKGAHRDIVALNAGALLYIAGKAKTIKEGVKLAESSIDSGKAMEKLKLLISPA
ncbi:MAG: anthranilate phosphoribosyltransferase [Candidatus Micrarchaeota archaeon]